MLYFLAFYLAFVYGFTKLMFLVSHVDTYLKQQKRV